MSGPGWTGLFLKETLAAACVILRDKLVYELEIRLWRYLVDWRRK